MLKLLAWNTYFFQGLLCHSVVRNVFWKIQHLSKILCLYFDPKLTFPSIFLFPHHFVPFLHSALTIWVQSIARSVSTNDRLDKWFLGWVKLVCSRASWASIAWLTLGCNLHCNGALCWLGWCMTLRQASWGLQGWLTVNAKFGKFAHNWLTGYI